MDFLIGGGIGIGLLAGLCMGVWLSKALRP